MPQKILLLLVFLLSPLFTFSWGNTGHRLIAEIAYEHLTPTARHSVNQLLQPIAPYYQNSADFVSVSVWADMLKFDDVHAFDSWHFINIPFSHTYRKKMPHVNPQNLVWALDQSLKVLNSDKANPFEKGFFLRFLIHLIGDAHQPLHCSTLVSKELPQGDQGGNLFPINMSDYDNLHSLWDDGVGLFQHNSLSPTAFIELARNIEDNYKESYFGTKINNVNPHDWVRECYLLGKNVAYEMEPNEKPSQAYIEKSQAIVEEQIALAGYRLAHILNNVSYG